MARSRRSDTIVKIRSYGLFQKEAYLQHSGQSTNFARTGSVLGEDDGQKRLWRMRTGSLALCVALLALAAPARAAGDRALGEYLSSECTSCHQLSGRSTGGIPPIVGWPQEQFVAVLEAYGSGERQNEVMRTIAARLSREDMASLAAYFASLAPKP